MRSIEQQVLYALFCLSRDTRHISAATLGAALSITPTQAASALLVLEHAGLVDASRARLTMLGLARAARQGSAQGGPRLDLRAAAQAGAKPDEKPGSARVPVAARPAVAATPAASPALASASEASPCRRSAGGDRALSSPPS